MNFFNWLKDKPKIILLSLIGSNIFFILFGIVMTILYFNKECICQNEEIVALNKEEVHEDDIKKDIHVEVKGAINNPGVYTLSEGSIINDLVNLAGGLKDTAYQDNINFSRKLSDEMVVYVYTKDEYKKNNNKVIETKCVCPTYDISKCTENKQSEIVAVDEDTALTNESQSNESPNNQKININTATKSELTKLSGIGDTKAEAIIEYRKNSGLFKTIEDLKKVSGIGDKTFEKIRDSIKV